MIDESWEARGPWKPLSPMALQSSGSSKNRQKEYVYYSTPDCTLTLRLMGAHCAQVSSFSSLQSHKEIALPKT